MFGDASDLGRAYYGFARPAVLLDDSRDLGKLAVEYAGLLALNHVMALDDANAVKGVLQYMTGTATRAATLAVDLREATWTKAEGDVHTPSVRDALVADVLGGLSAQALARAQEWYGANVHAGAAIADDVNQIAFALTGGPAPGALPGTATNGLAVAVLSDGSNTMNGGAGRDLIVGGTGDDIIYGGARSDVLFAGFGHDELHGGDGRDLLIAGGGDDVLYGDGGADTFMFDGSDHSAMFVGGAGTDVYDLRGSSGHAHIVINKGDGRDKLMSDADGFNFAALKFLPGERVPDAPVAYASLYLPDRSLAEVEIVWKIAVTDTHRLGDRQIQLVHGHILVRDKAADTLILDMGEYVGTRTTFTGNKNVSYDFSIHLGPRIHLSDGDFASIGDGVWPDMIVI